MEDPSGPVLGEGASWWLRQLKNLPANGELGTIQELGKSLEEEMATHSGLLLENSHGQRAWWATVRGIPEKNEHD